MHALLVGKRRMGKSTLALKLAFLHSNIVIVYDPNTQFREFGPAQSVYQINAQMAFLESDEAEPLAEPLVMVFRPRTGMFEEDFEALSDMLWQWNGFSLIVDESPTLQTPHAINARLDRWIRNGPAGVSIYQTCHRVNDLNRLSRSLCSDYFFFRSNQKKDVAQMAAEFDDRLERLLPSLGAWEVIHYWLAKGGQGEISIWRDPKVWFVELGHGETEGDHGGGGGGDDDDLPAGQPNPLLDYSTVPAADDVVHRGLADEGAGE